MTTDPRIIPNVAPSEGSTCHQEPADGSNVGLAAPGAGRPSEARTELPAPEGAAYPPSFGWFCPAVANCPDAGRGLYVTAEAASDAQGWHVAAVHGQTPSAAPAPASQRPQVAGEPKSGQDGAAGSEAALDRTRRYLVPVAALKLPGHPNDRHLAVYEWVPRLDAWATGSALCGYTTRQGALPDSLPITCAECRERRPDYERYLEGDRARLPTALEVAEAAVARVREWIASEPVDARNEFGNGYREALRDIGDLLGTATP